MSLRIKTEDGDIVVADVGGGGGGGGSDYEVVKVETTAKTITAPEGACYFALAKTEGLSTYVEDGEVYGKVLVYKSYFSTYRNTYTEVFSVSLENIKEPYDYFVLDFVGWKDSNNSVYAYFDVVFTDNTTTYFGKTLSKEHKHYTQEFTKPIKRITAAVSPDYYYMYLSDITLRTFKRNGYLNSCVSEVKINGSTKVAIVDYNSLPECNLSGNIIDYCNGKYYYNNTIDVTNSVITPLEEPIVTDLDISYFPYKISEGDTIEFTNTRDIDMPITVLFKKAVKNTSKLEKVMNSWDASNDIIKELLDS